MANVQYADPFGSYVRGASAGNEAAIRTAEAARSLRNQDLNYDFMKWYQPFRQREAAAATGEAELGLNRNIQQNAAGLTAFGGPGQAYLSDTLQHLYPGYNFGNLDFRDPLSLERAARTGTGLPPSFYDPSVASQGHYGSTKITHLSPEEYEMDMSMRYGPNWRTSGAPGGSNPGQGSYNAYGAATGSMFGVPPVQTEQAQPSGPTTPGAGVPQYQQSSPYAPRGMEHFGEPMNYNRPTEQRSIWADGGQ